MRTTRLHVKLEAFEGPFDLLLELARENKVDLRQVALAEITADFLEYVRQGKIPAALQADFLVVAATLLLLKIRRMLPRLDDEEEREVAELTDRLRVYQLYRERALLMRAQWQKEVLVAGPARWELYRRQGPLAMSGMELRGHFEAVVARMRPTVAPTRHLRGRGRSVAACLALLRERLARVREVLFNDLVVAEGSGSAAVTLLACLEMAKRHEVCLYQEHMLAPLGVKKLRHD